MTPEEIEWARMKRMRPSSAKAWMLGILLATLVGGGVFGAVLAFAAHAEKQHARMEASGLTEVCVDARTGTTTAGPCNTEALGAFALLVVAIGSLGGFAAGFRLGGGKISAEHLRAFRQA